MLKEKKFIWLVVILIILLTLIAIYIGIKEYKKYKEKIETEAYQQGMKDAIVNMHEKGDKCEVVTLLVDNNRVSFIPIDCLEKKGEE